MAGICITLFETEDKRFSGCKRFFLFNYACLRNRFISAGVGIQLLTYILIVPQYINTVHSRIRSRPWLDEIWPCVDAGWDLAESWMRSSQVVRASESRRRNCPGFDPESEGRQRKTEKKEKNIPLKNSANFFSHFCALENGPKFDSPLSTL
jgi:hypothetical protein